MSYQRFGLAATLAMLLIGVVAGMIPALQGLLLPQLAREGRLTLPEIGQVAMAEALGTLIAITLANAKLRPHRLRRFAAAVGIATVMLNLLTPHLTGMEIMAARFAHGLCAGILLWMWVGFLTRSANPGRLVAFDVALQAGIIASLAALFSASIIPHYGAMGAFTVVAGIYGVIGLLTTLIPHEFDPLPGNSGTVLPTFRGFIALITVFALVSAIVATWVYLKPHGEQIGLTAERTNMAISTALTCKVIAALLMTAIAGYLRPTITLLSVVPASIVTLFVLLSARSPIVFTSGVAVFVFLWMFTTPLLMPYLITVDPTRRSAIHIGTAQLLGAAAGPAMASQAVSIGGTPAALMLAAALYGLGILAIIVTTLSTRGLIGNRPAVRCTGSLE
jgi:hypothetical protein